MSGLSQKEDTQVDLGTPYFEVALTLSNRVTRFATAEELGTYTGFRSYFGFSEAIKEYCKEFGSNRGMRGTVVYSDCIFIDYDDCPDAAEEMWHILVGEKLGFEVWDSGGRSIHFHIPHKPMWSEHLPYSHRKWVESRSPKADMSLYQAGRIFRLPGTVHTTHLRKKVLLEMVEGKMPEIELFVQPLKSVAFGSFVADGDGIAEITGLLTRLANFPPQEGERNRKLYAAVCSCLSCGFSGEFALELISKVNSDLMESSIEDEELQQIVGSAAQSFGG
jgi:hypothetical protein